MENAVEFYKKADAYESRIEYWDMLSREIDLSMPESLDFYETQLLEAQEYHAGLKSGEIKREHSYSLTYAKKRVNTLKKKFETAQKLWGEN